MEKRLGVRLLNRTTRSIHLTEEGAQYLERCRGILSAMQDAEASVVSGQAEPQGRLAVTASIVFGRRYVAQIVSESWVFFTRMMISGAMATTGVTCSRTA